LEEFWDFLQGLFIFAENNTSLPQNVAKIMPSSLRAPQSQSRGLTAGNLGMPRRLAANTNSGSKSNRFSLAQPKPSISTPTFRPNRSLVLG